MDKFDLVSTCCGGEFSEVYYGEDMSMCCERALLDDGRCSKCKEHCERYSDTYDYYCSECDEGFDEPESQWEWVERMKENFEN